VSIGDVADDLVTLETCPQIPARFIEGPAFTAADWAQNPFTGWESEPATLHLYRLRNIVLDRAHMVLLHRGRLIEETNYLQPADALARLRVDPVSLIRPRLDHAVATCFDHWTTNYFHWMTHGAVTLHAILARGAARPAGIVIPALLPWQQDLIAAAGAAALPATITEPGHQYFFPQFHYYDTVRGTADYAISALSRAAYAKLGASVPAAPGACAKIYIDRSGAPYRRLPNEAALIAALAARGFAPVRLEELTLAQQIALFRGAAMVVGLHGAGLANIAFCRPGTVIYELVAANYRNPCYLAMAMNLGLNYWADMFAAGGAVNDYQGGWDTDIDVGRVIRRVAQLEPFSPPLPR